MEKSDVNNIDIYNITVDKFAKKLYKYRNSIVHGKLEDTNLLLHVPMNLLDNDEYIRLKGWNVIAEKLAVLCIHYFCFDNIDDIDL